MKIFGLLPKSSLIILRIAVNEFFYALTKHVESVLGFINFIF